MMVEKSRVLVADDEERLHDFFIEALKDEAEEGPKAELRALERQLFQKGGQALPAISFRFDHEYDLTLCTSARTAVDHVIRSLEENRPFSVVFLDVRMPPGPDGIWAAEKIRDMDKDVEIVIVTAFSDIHPADILRRVPPAHKLLYLQKPCYVQEIRHMAASLTSKWIMERELIRIQRWQKEHIRNQKTALDEAYHSLERLQKLDALGMFAGGMAHDFNNIMTAILGHTEMGLMDSMDNPEVYSRMEYIHKACNKAKDLVRRILTFSRQDEPEYEPMSPGSVILEVIRLIHASVPETVRVRQEVRETGIMIYADPTQVHQVIMNLCSNAIYAMRDRGGTLTIRLDKPGAFNEIPNAVCVENLSDYVLLYVADTGEGMPPETQEKIFDPYFTTKGKNEGTGLGLAVLHGIIKKQGGFIHVESTPGEGTAFYVFFKALSL